jgi:hypothetical protein
MAKYKFFLISLLNVFLTLNAYGQWKLKIIGESSLKKLQFEHISTSKIETSKIFQDIILPPLGDSLFSDSQRKALQVRCLEKNKWGLMNGQFKTLIKPQFNYLEILINKISKFNPEKKPEIQCYLGFKDSKFYLYDLDFKNIDKFGFSSVQGLGMDFEYPTQLSEQDFSSILREQDNQQMVLLHPTPILVLSKHGKRETKHFKYTNQGATLKIDSNGEEFVPCFYDERKVFYYHIADAKWNIYEVFKRKLLFTQWQDSIKFTYVLASNISDTLNNESILDSLNRYPKRGMLVNFNNHEYEKLHEVISSIAHDTKLLCIPICFISLNASEKIFDLRNTHNTFPNLNRPAEIFNAPTGMSYIGIKENNRLRLYDFIEHSFYEQDFDSIYPNEYVTLPTPAHLEELYAGRFYNCVKVRMNQKMGVYHFEDSQFYEIKGLEDVDFKQDNYTHPLSFYRGGSKFFIGKSDGKWGLTTLNIFETNDSVAVPFIYDSLVFDHYNINNFVFWFLRAKKNNEWKIIDLQNNPIIIPNKDEENLLLMKEFFDIGHQGMSNYYVLTNPTGTKTRNAIELSDSYSDFDFEAPRIGYTSDGVSGGKTLVYNNFLRKVVDESLYDSIWLITADDVNNKFDYGYANETYYRYFNWSNSYHLQDMINSYSYFTIPYFLIFKNGLNAIISDKNEIIVPFTKEKIVVSRRNIINIKNSGNDETEEDEEYEYVTAYIFSTPTKTFSVNN